MDQDPPPRKRGAPKGNKNAYKHGFYSSRPKVKEHVSPNQAGGRLQPDIDLYRTVLRRITAGLIDPSGPSPSLEENLAALQAVYIAVARLNGLWHTNVRLFADDNKSLFTALRRPGFSEEQIDSEIFVKDKRPRGGQAGNANALKYGLYTRAIPPEEVARLEQHKGTALDDELTLLRVIISRASISLLTAPKVDFKLRLKTLRLIDHAIQVIEKLERTRRLAFTMPAPAQMDEYLDQVIRNLSPHEPEGAE